MRIARDTRFSADKSPVPHAPRPVVLGGRRARAAQSAGYFVRLDPDAVTLGVGAHHFTDRGARRLPRAPSTTAGRGAELDRAVRDALTAGARFGPARWKRVPAPYAADHPRADLLRHDGLVAATTDPMPPAGVHRGVPRSGASSGGAPLRPLQAWVAAVAAEAAALAPTRPGAAGDQLAAAVRADGRPSPRRRPGRRCTRSCRCARRRPARAGRRSARSGYASPAPCRNDTLPRDARRRPPL